MSRFSLILLAAMSAPVAAQNAAPDPLAQITMAANAYDRCMTTYAVKLLESGLGDDDLYIVASTMCRDLDEVVKQRINSGLPAAQAKELLARVNADPKGDYLKKLQAIRNGRARRPR